jgi:Sensors of blue-light using FAD
VVKPKQDAQDRDLISADSAAVEDFEIDQILYCSIAKQPMDEHALHALAESVAPINRMDHITGLLMYSDNVFVQLIEGPRQAMQHLWSRLLRDSRHFGIVQLYHYRELESRTCQSWDMKLVSFDTLQAIVRNAHEEVRAGRRTVWAHAIERMDFLLSDSNWDNFVKELKQQN